MPFNWTFSPEGQDLLQKIILAASPPDDNNKWYRAFGKRSSNEDFNGNQQDSDVPIKKMKLEESENILTVENVKLVPVVSQKTTENIDEEFIQALENDTVTKLEVLVSKCTGNPNLLNVVAEKLSTAAIEKLCNCVLDKNYHKTDFLEMFYDKFLPTFFRKDSSWLSLDVLAKCNEKDPVLYKKLSFDLLKDDNVPYKLLQDYIQSLSDKDKNIFMNNLLTIELTKQEFTRHIFTIYVAYKSCDKTENIQNYMLEYLLLCYQDCISDRNYGRLLMTYLQTQKAMGPIKEWKKLESVIENHRSPFMKPCATIFKTILDKN